MNPQSQTPDDRNDFDSPPEREWAALFAESAPPARPVDVAVILSAAKNLAGSDGVDEILRCAQNDDTVPTVEWSRPYFQRRSPMFRRIAVLVSATAGVIAIAGMFMLFGSSTQLTFAQVAEQIAKTRSVTCKQTVSIPGKPAETTHIAILADGLFRADMPNGDYTVQNMMNGQALCVSPLKKKAIVMLGLGMPSINLYEMVRNIVSEKSERLPDETIDGRKTNVFRVEADENIRKQARGPMPPMKVWVDPETKLPIRMAPIAANKEKSDVVIYDIVFDEPLDPSRFSLKPPEGYTVTTVGTPATWQQTPPPKKDLLAPEVIPGVGLGPVKFGMSKEEVIKLLGKPDVEEKTTIQYSSRGYACSISPRRGLMMIQCFSQQGFAFKVRDFAGKTKEGIGIGSSLKNLEKAFGKPTAVEHTDQPGATGTYVRYTKLGLDFTLIDDKAVDSFMMQAVR